MGSAASVRRESDYDFLPLALAEFRRHANSPAAARLRSIRIGPSDLFDALRYDTTDAFYDELYRAAAPNQTPAPSLNVFTRNLWAAQFGQEFLTGLLSSQLGPLGDTIDAIRVTWPRRVDTKGIGKINILIAGSLYRRSVEMLAPMLHILARDRACTHLVVAHDDVLRRHAAAFDRRGLNWRPAAGFVTRADRTASAEIAARAGACGVPPRTIRRMAIHFFAARRAMEVAAPSLVIVPDERQPLARLVGLEARAHGVPVVAAPLQRDQIFRKTPPFDSTVATQTFVFSALAARFLSRGGNLNHGAAAVRWASSVAPPGQDRRTAGSPTILFASQGHARNAVLLPMLARTVRDLPGARLVVRPHPYESAAMLRLMIRGAHVSAEGSAADAIAGADVVVTHSSFMAVEAAVAGRPVVLLSADAVPSLLPLIDEGLAVWVSTEPALRAELQRFLRPGEHQLVTCQRRFAREQASVPGPGFAADAITRLLT